MQPFLESVEYHPVGALNLAIGPRVSDGDIPNIDPAGLAVLPELVAIEVGAQICDDAVGEAIAVHDLIQEVEYPISLGQVMGLTSIHLVNLSIATRTLLNPPGAVSKGPIMSSPQQANGQVGGIVISLWAGTCCCLAKNWHPWHLRTSSSASTNAVGQ